jgi:rare lipoprotein A
LALSGCINKEANGPEKKSQATSKPTHKEVGEASWYGPGFNGHKTASGEIYDQTKMTAAHPSLPLGTEVKVTNLENNKKVDVEITDRGPYGKGRAIDLSKAAAKKLDMTEDGLSNVKIETTKPVQKSHKAKKKQLHSRKVPSKTAKEKTSLSPTSK